MRETNIDWIFQGPACAVLIINLIFLCRIMWVRVTYTILSGWILRIQLHTPSPLTTIRRSANVCRCFFFFVFFLPSSRLPKFYFIHTITTSKRTCCISEHIPLIIISCFHFVPSLGTYYEITLGKHTGNSSVSKGNKSSSRTHTIVRYYVSGGYGWAERRCGSLHFCRSTSCIVKYTGMGSVERITANIFLLIFFFVFVAK